MTRPAPVHAEDTAGMGHTPGDTEAAVEWAFAEALARSVASQRAAAREDLATIPGRLAELARRFVALDRQLPAATRRLAELEALGNPAAFAAAELGRVRAVSRVQDVQVDADALLVVTEPVVVQWADARYALGRYQLHLSLDGDARIESLDRLGPRASWDHPHVQDGIPCLGNLREGVLKLIAEYELALAAQLLIDFLYLYQPEDAYTPIEGWPRHG